MPYDDPSADDPMALVGTEVAADARTHVEMAYTFAEEFAQLGFDEERLLRIFTNPTYAGAHRLMQLLGEERIREVIREVLLTWGRSRVRHSEGDCDESSV